MTGIDVEEYLAGLPLELVGDDLTSVPEQWWPIVAAGDARTRCAYALALWNEDFVAMLPTFWATMRDRLLDVRVAGYLGEAALIYVSLTSEGTVFSYAGWDAATFGDVMPPFWDHFPEPFQRFLTDVHAGFGTMPDGYAGPSRPRYMETLAAWVGEPDGFPGYDEGQAIPSTRLCLIADWGNHVMLYAVSPDVPIGRIVPLYEGDQEPAEFGEEMDSLLHRSFEQ
jgi:hypothetical protein